MSTTTETVTRPPRAPAASVILTAMAVVSALLLAPVTSAAASEPLPPGAYVVTVANGRVTVAVAPDGSVEVSASDGLVVRLAFDEGGRALDEFTVSTDAVSYRVEVEVEDDGTYSSDIKQEPMEGPTGDHGRIVSTVARCTPAGLVAGAVGLPNHGTIVSAAASGLSLVAEVTDPISGEATTVEADFSTLAGAEDFCAQVDAAVPTLDEVREILEAEAAAARATRATAAQERAAAQAAIARARAAERAAQRAAERAAARTAAADEDRGRPDAPGASQDAADGERPERDEDRSGSGDAGRPADEGSDASTGDQGGTTDDATDDATATDGSEDTGTTDGDDTTDQDTTDGSTTDGSTGSTGEEPTGPGQGQGGGKPTEPGANGKGPSR